MNIDIREALLCEGELYTSDYHGAFAGIDFLGEHYDFPQGIDVSASYCCDGVEGVIVTGRFDAQATVHCARCLEPFLYTIGFQFAEYYKKQPEEGEYEFAGETIELDRMLEDNVVANLPTRVLCREDCKGLCSHCGKDLNEGECGCLPEVEEPDNAFVGLSKLYNDEEV
jgi:uncharacterized protein